MIATAQLIASDTANPTSGDLQRREGVRPDLLAGGPPLLGDAQRGGQHLRAHPGGGDEPLPGDQPDGDEDEGRQDGGEGAADAPGAEGGRFRRAPRDVSMVALLRWECSKATMLHSAKPAGLHHGAPWGAVRRLDRARLRHGAARYSSVNHVAKSGRAVNGLPSGPTSVPVSYRNPENPDHLSSVCVPTAPDSSRR